MPPAPPALSPCSTLQDCSSYALTVAPHIAQLETYIPNFLQAVSSSNPGSPTLSQFYVSTNPLITSFVFSLALSPIFLLTSEINKNFSQVDRCWSLLPAVHALHYAVWAHLSPGVPTARIDLVAAVVTCWSARLTFNYWRRGGYQKGSEDYRWVEVQRMFGQPLFFLFNVVFIATAQSVLLFLVTTPIYVLLLSSRITGDTLTVSDMAFAGLMLVAIATSATADQQQWNYQETKKRYLSNPSSVPDPGYTSTQLRLGFNTHGLWSISRHPNFAAEQSHWLLLYQWSCYTTYVYYSWAGAGALGYVILFQASTWLTERMTRAKYGEAYGDYQSRVSRFVPKPTAVWVRPVGEEWEKAWWERGEGEKEGKGKGKAGGKKKQ